MTQKIITVARLCDKIKKNKIVVSEMKDTTCANPAIVGVPFKFTEGEKQFEVESIDLKENKVTLNKLN